MIRRFSKSEDDGNVILIFYNSESTKFHLNVDTMQVIGDFLESAIFTFDHGQVQAY